MLAGHRVHQNEREIPSVGVPFDFIAGGVRLPAGNYLVTQQGQRTLVSIASTLAATSWSARADAAPPSTITAAPITIHTFTVSFFPIRTSLTSRESTGFSCVDGQHMAERRRDGDTTVTQGPV